MQIDLYPGVHLRVFCLAGSEWAVFEKFFDTNPICAENFVGIFKTSPTSATEAADRIEGLTPQQFVYFSTLFHLHKKCEDFYALALAGLVNTYTPSQ